MRCLIQNREGQMRYARTSRASAHQRLYVWLMGKGSRQIRLTNPRHAKTSSTKCSDELHLCFLTCVKSIQV